VVRDPLLRLRQRTADNGDQFPSGRTALADTHCAAFDARIAVMKVFWALIHDHGKIRRIFLIRGNRSNAFSSGIPRR